MLALRGNETGKCRMMWMYIEGYYAFHHQYKEGSSPGRKERLLCFLITIISSFLVNLFVFLAFRAGLTFICSFLFSLKITFITTFNMKTNAALFLAAVARMAAATDGVTGKPYPLAKRILN